MSRPNLYKYVFDEHCKLPLSGGGEIGGVTILVSI